MVQKKVSKKKTTKKATGTTKKSKNAPGKKRAKKKISKAPIPKEMKPYMVKKGTAVKTSEEAEKAKLKHWEKFNFFIPGICKKDVEHFLRIHKRKRFRNEAQTLRYLMYKLDEVDY